MSTDTTAQVDASVSQAGSVVARLSVVDRWLPVWIVAAMAAGLALVPEDRRQQGLVMEISVERNATLTRRWERGSRPCSRPRTAVTGRNV